MRHSEEKKISKLERIISKVASYLKQHWVIPVLLNLLAIAIPFVYTYAGVSLHLVVAEGSQLTKWGIIISVVYAILYFIGNGALLYDQKRDLLTISLREELEEQTENAAVLSTLKRSTSAICDSKLGTLIDKIDYYRSNPAVSPALIISEPKKQLGALVNELSHCIASLLKFDNKEIDDIFTSIIYRFSQEKDEWYWATRERGLSINVLNIPVNTPDDRVKVRKSTFLTLIEGKGHLQFKNSKEDAYRDGCYLPDDEDEYDDNGKLKGSIACFQYQIKKNNVSIIDFVITISSYSRQFIPPEENEGDAIVTTRENIDKVIMSDFVLRTKIELCLLYLEYLNNQHSSAE